MSPRPVGRASRHVLATCNPLTRWLRAYLPGLCGPVIGRTYGEGGTGRTTVCGALRRRERPACGSAWGYASFRLRQGIQRLLLLSAPRGFEVASDSLRERESKWFQAPSGTRGCFGFLTRRFPRGGPWHRIAPGGIECLLRKPSGNPRWLSLFLLSQQLSQHAERQASKRQ